MSNNNFSFRQFTIEQDRCAMKVGTDGTLLGAWASLPEHTATTPRLLDIGTGTGLIALMLAQRFPEAVVDAIDIDEAAVRQSRENISRSPFASRIKVLHTSLQHFCQQTDLTYDAIVCNPPFFHHALICPEKERAVARHTVSLDFHTLFTCAAKMLSPKGHFSVIIPVSERREMEQAAALSLLFLVRETLFFTSPKKPAKRLLLTFSPSRFTSFSPTLLPCSTITLGDATYQQLTHDFYLHG